MNIEGWDEFSDEEQELLLDLGQLALDLIGIVEPTPFADSTNAIISITRGDWWGSLLSGVGVVPYIGDLAKFGKLPKYTRSFDKAMSIARRNPSFAVPVRALASRILVAIRKLPIERLPISARRVLEDLHRKLSDFLGGGLRISRLDQLTDETLRLVFGSTKHVGLLPRKNIRTIVEFFDKYNVGGRQPTQWAELIKGIDLHAVEPVKVVKIPKGEMFAQYVDLTKDANRQIGQWMVRARGAVSHRNIGLSEAGRERKLFQLKRGAEMLHSKAAAAADHWTKSGPKPHSAVSRGEKSGLLEMKRAEQVAGGGEQFFLPRAWELLAPVTEASAK
ncbi:hypothetical protein U8335_28345 [Roseiconus lacunae]|uniref:hypothetical protein n=1 Tax=Roseiconus lacunae TaxID=2605694 RepID=UPI00309025E8|nr:hypothetical protein U8335_28345 [Stieleria sp. HD01]